MGGLTGDQGVVGEGWLARYSAPSLENIETITDQHVASVDGKTVLRFTKSRTLSEKVWIFTIELKLKISSLIFPGC